MTNRESVTVERVICARKMDRLRSIGDPTNRRDRALFAGLSESRQREVRELAASLYDGSRTIARCWKEALGSADVEDAALKRVESGHYRTGSGHCVDRTSWNTWHVKFGGEVVGEGSTLSEAKREVIADIAQRKAGLR